MSATEKCRDQSLLDRASPGYRAARLAEMRAGQRPERIVPEVMTTVVGGFDAGRCTLRGGERAVWVTFMCHEGVKVRTVIPEALAHALANRLGFMLCQAPAVEAVVDTSLDGLALPAADPERGLK